MEFGGKIDENARYPHINDWRKSIYDEIFANFRAMCKNGMTSSLQDLIDYTPKEVLDMWLP
jgi:hypothetical protein